MLDFRGFNVSTGIKTGGLITVQVNPVVSLPFRDCCVVDATNDINFGTYINSFVQILMACHSSRVAVSCNMNAKHWGIQQDSENATVQQTTLRGVCHMANPALSHSL